MSVPASTSRATRMRVLGPIVLLVTSLVLGLGVTELCYRTLRRFVCVGAPASTIWRLDPEYGWGHRPGGDGVWYSCLGRRFEWYQHIHINALGLRDRERTYARSAGTKRVLLLGDSITEAMQVPLDDTFAAVLESDLRERGVPVEVVNAGVAAYGTDNELLFFRSEGVRYGADVVVLVFNVVNDVAENSVVLHRRMYSASPEKLLAKTYFHVDAQGKLAADPMHFVGPPTIPWRERIEDNLYLVRAVRRLVGRSTASATAPATPQTDLTVYQVDDPAPDPQWLEAWRVTEALIREIRADVERSGARFMVAVMPSREAVSPAAWKTLLQLFPALAATPHDPEYPVTRITEFLRSEGIPFVSLLPALRSAAERTGKTGYFTWDVHLDTSGHLVVGKTLAPAVAELLTSP